MDVGDRVTVAATIRSFVTDMASVAIPSFNHPFSVRPTKGAKVGDEVYVFGEVTRAEDHAITVDFDDGGRVTLNEDVLSLVEKAKPQKFAGSDNARRPR
jgi:hypothetical protein